MAANKFSEFTFGFAFTQEVTSACWAALPGAPEMPSLYDEGNGKGFDVAIGLSGWTLFAQFKRGEHLTRSNASEWWENGSQAYYRFPIYPESKSTQHADLLQLDSASVFNWVMYVAPVFHTAAVLNSHFLNKRILDQVKMVRPSSVGPTFGDEHRITYKTVSDVPQMFSEPRRIESVSAVELRGQWQVPVGKSDPQSADDGPDNRQTPRRLDARYFDEVLDQMMSVAADSRAGRSVNALLSEATDSMSSFGRARTAGRLLFDAELIALPAPGQAVPDGS